MRATPRGRQRNFGGVLIFTETPEILPREVPDFRRNGEVRAMMHDLDAMGLGESRPQCFDFVCGAETVERDRAARRGEVFRDDDAESAGGTGDEGGFAEEIFFHKSGW